jgi:hypothetical protein
MDDHVQLENLALAACRFFVVATIGCGIFPISFFIYFGE